jgi:hypothetical protein
VQIKKPMELKKGNVFEGGAGLAGVYALEVDEDPRMFPGLLVARVKVCELDWPLAIPADEDVRVL